MRGGRNMDRHGASRGEEKAIQIPVVTVCVGCRTGVSDGSPWKMQHEHTPLHSSCDTGAG
jgi:hypothetical protein